VVGMVAIPQCQTRVRWLPHVGGRKADVINLLESHKTFLRRCMQTGKADETVRRVPGSTARRSQPPKNLINSTTINPFF
jgi:hypothetical protein